jgi:hypothetical protein
VGALEDAKARQEAGTRLEPTEDERAAYGTAALEDLFADRDVVPAVGCEAGIAAVGARFTCVGLRADGKQAAPLVFDVELTMPDDKAPEGSECAVVEYAPQSGDPEGWPAGDLPATGSVHHCFESADEDR